MRWIRPLSAETDGTPEVLGGKAHGLIILKRLGLPVPAGFVVTTEAYRSFLREGRLPDGLRDELSSAVTALEAETGRGFGDHDNPLTVSVRSGAGISMPGMMTTLLDLGPADLEQAVADVFASWDTPRARTYRALHTIPDSLGTAVTVQAMVFGTRDDHSGSGVAFTHDPDTGEHTPFGEVLFGRQGTDLVSGGSRTRPLRDLAAREPRVWTALADALRRVGAHHRDACYTEFTFESGELWILQLRPARLVGAAAVRVAVELAEEGVIGRDEALLRVSPHHLQYVRTPRIATPDVPTPDVPAPDVPAPDVPAPDVLARGLGACPGVAVGRLATSADQAVRMAADGPVVLVRPETSPLDMRGLAAAAGVVTARGGPASHAAVVARSMNRPAVVGVAELTVGPAGARVGDRELPEGALIAIDGTGGEVVLGEPRVTISAASRHLHQLLTWADEASGGTSGRDEADRVRAAHEVLRRTETG
ncbi:PEP/pyruvate-binding domain-containing protein [Nocardiopsis oceani]